MRSRSGLCGIGSCGDGGIDFLAVLPADTGRRCSVATAHTGSDTDNVRMDGAGHAVRNFYVELRYDIL